MTGVLILAFISGVGGGVARDIIINEVPQIFTSGFYGSVTLIVALILFLLNLAHFINFLSLTILLIFGVILRLIAYYNKWQIPKL